MHPIWHGLIQMQGVLWLFVTTTKVQTHRSQDQWHMILPIVIYIYDTLDQTNYSPHVWCPIFLTFGVSKIKTFVFQAYLFVSRGLTPTLPHAMPPQTKDIYIYVYTCFVHNHFTLALEWFPPTKKRTSSTHDTFFWPRPRTIWTW